jgi:transcription antitermination factor NusG
MRPAFLGFGPEDFDAFEERKWSSNRFNLERMRAREKLCALADAVAPAAWLDRFGLERGVTHDHPTIFNHRRVTSQWVYFLRSQEDRRRLSAILDREHPLRRQIEDAAEHHMHALIGLELHLGGLDVFVGMHRTAWVDAKNLFQKVSDPYELERLMDLVRALPEPFALSHPDGPVPAASVAPAHLEALQRSLTPEGATEWLRLGVSLDRSDARLADPALTDVIGEVLLALGPVYAYAAWRPDNDQISVKEQLRTEKKVRKARSRDLTVGARVRVTGGLFAGREGQVAELDGKGAARIVMGPMSVKVAVRELQPLDG